MLQVQTKKKKKRNISANGQSLHLKQKSLVNKPKALTQQKEENYIKNNNGDRPNHLKTKK